MLEPGREKRRGRGVVENQKERVRLRIREEEGRLRIREEEGILRIRKDKRKGERRRGVAE